MKISEAIRIRSNAGGKLGDFMEEYYELTEPHPFGNARIYQNTMLEVYPFNGMIHLSAIVTTQPRSGAGTNAMKFLMELANKHRVKIDIEAKPFSKNNEHIRDMEQLVRWYMRLGFRITDDLVDDPSDLEGIEGVNMTYFPK